MTTPARPASQTQTCGTCGARVAETRRGRCWGCYSKWSELRPVGQGATCVLCHERRRGSLRLMEIHGRSLPFCHGCAGQTLKLTPLPFTVEAIRAALVRNRRQVERRIGALDSRVFPRERRIEARRETRDGPAAAGAETLAGDELYDLHLEEDVQEADIIEVTTVCLEPQPAPAPASESGN